VSYMQFQQQCKDCKKHWNAAFGIVGTTQIAAPPRGVPLLWFEQPHQVR
jgi:hypothetical protein